MKDKDGHELYEGKPMHESNDIVESTFYVKLPNGQRAQFERMRCKLCGVVMSRPAKSKKDLL